MEEEAISWAAEVATGASEVDEEAATAVEEDTATSVTALPLADGAAGAELSSARVQPEFLVMAAIVLSVLRSFKEVWGCEMGQKEAYPGKKPE